MYLRSFIKFCLLLLNSLAVAQSPQNQFTNLTPNKDINTTRFLLSNKTGCNTCKPKDSKNVQYLDNQTIAGYTFSKKHNNAMNMHPELGIGIGFKKYRFTTGITGTIRFIKTRQSYNYYYNKYGTSSDPYLNQEINATNKPTESNIKRNPIITLYCLLICQGSFSLGRLDLLVSFFTVFAIFYLG